METHLGYNPFEVEGALDPVAVDYELLRRHPRFRAIITAFKSNKDRFFKDGGQLDIALPDGSRERGRFDQQPFLEQNPRLGSFIWTIFEWLTAEPQFEELKPTEVMNDKQLYLGSDGTRTPLMWTPQIIVLPGQPDEWTEKRHKEFVAKNGETTFDTPFPKLPPPMQNDLRAKHKITQDVSDLALFFEQAPDRVTLRALNGFNGGDALELAFLRSLVEHTWLVSFDLHQINSKQELESHFSEAYKIAAKAWEEEIGPTAPRGRRPQEAFEFLLMAERVHRARANQSDLSEMGCESTLSDYQALALWQRSPASSSNKSFDPKDAYYNQLKPLRNRIESMFDYRFPECGNALENSHT